MLSGRIIELDQSKPDLKNDSPPHYSEGEDEPKPTTCDKMAPY